MFIFTRVLYVNSYLFRFDRLYSVYKFRTKYFKSRSFQMWIHFQFVLCESILFTFSFCVYVWIWYANAYSICIRIVYYYVNYYRMCYEFCINYMFLVFLATYTHLMFNFTKKNIYIFFFFTFYIYPILKCQYIANVVICFIYDKR